MNRNDSSTMINEIDDAEKAAADRRLDAAGWVTASVADFLGMSKEEVLTMELHVGLQDVLKSARKRSGFTQAHVAEKIGTGQARIARIESGSTRGVTIDFLLRAAFAAGATIEDVGDVFAQAVEYAASESNGVTSYRAASERLDNGPSDVPVATK